VSTWLSELVAEWRRIILDPGAALILVGALALYAVFYPIPYRANVLERVPVVVVDQDQSDLSRRLVRMVDEHPLTAVVGQAGSLLEAEKAVQEGRAGGVLVIPAEFERCVRRGEQAHVGAFADASYFLVYRQALTGMLEATGTLSAGIEVRRLMAEGIPAERAMKARDPLPLVSRPLFNSAEGYAAYIVPAVLVLIPQQTLLVGMGLVGGTRRETYVGRLLRAGVSGGSEDPPYTRSDTGLATLTARAFAYYALYLVHGLFYFGVVYRLYGFPVRADAWTLLQFGTPFLLSVIFLGLTLRAAFRSREMALQALLFTSLPALFLSGFAWPTEALPAWLATFAKAIPSTSAIPGFLRLTQMGASLSDVGAEWLTLWGLCGAYFVAAWMVTWRES
jgi:ABC-2 type transport system permease protein